VRIEPVTEATPLLRTESAEGARAAPSAEGDDVSFGDVFAQMIQQANHADAVAASKVDGLARGVNDDIHGTMIATKEADISIKLVGSIRNKLLDAFNEIWKTSV
jgi:flagellar hook-basal body complex protein FliE